MDAASVTLRQLAAKVLQGDGSLPLALLLEHLVPVRALRELVRRHGVTVKGGFRIERAPARVLAARLAEERDPSRLDDVLKLLLPPEPESTPAASAESREGASEAQALLSLREGELQQARAELERARDGANRAREREADLTRQLQSIREELVRAQKAVAEQASPPPRPAARGERELEARVHDLESERAGYLEAADAARRQLAVDRTRMRQLENELAELEALVPPSRRRKQRALPPVPEPDRSFVLPRFLPSFYKSLEGKDRRAVERAIQAVLLFCTEGHAYPGLEVKQLGGQDTWSLRASLGLRVYFRQSRDGEIELLELGDREDQNTTLRRLKDRG